MIALTVRLVVSLAVVVGLLLLTARLGSRRFRSASGSPVRVVHRQALSRSSSIAVVEVGARTLLIGTTEHQVNLLGDLTGDLPRELPATGQETLAVDGAPAGDRATDLVDGTVPAGFGPQLAAALASRATRTSSRLRLADTAETADTADAVLDTTVVTGEVTSLDTTTATPVAAIAPAAKPAGSHRRGGSHAGKRRATGPTQQVPATAVGQGPLAGSVLSPQTWRQAAAVARGRGR